MAVLASLYEGYVDYKGPKDKHYKSCFAQLRPKQLLLKESITSSEPTSVYIQEGKYGEGKSHEKKKIFEFYMDGMTGRHHFKVNVASQRKHWLEYFKIADQQVDIGVYDKVVIHQQSRASYGNVQQTSTLPSCYAETSKVVPKSGYDTMPVRTSEATPRRGADVYQQHKQKLQGRSDNPPPLPPGRPDIPPPLPPMREEFSPPLPPEREDSPPPPLPPGRPADQVDSGVPMPGVPGIQLPVTMSDLQKRVSNGPAKKHKAPTLEKRDSGIASGDGTIRHPPQYLSGDGTVRHAVPGTHHSINTSRSAPSSGDGEFGRRSRSSDRGTIDEGCPSSNDCTPNHSGGGTVQHGKSHLHFKWCIEGVGRVDVENMLKEEQEGTFVYRIDDKKQVITIKRSDKVYHHLVQKRENGLLVFKGLENVTGTSIYDIVSNYIDYCGGKITPYGGSIDAKKEGHEDYDKPWNPPDVKFLVNQVAKELEASQIKKKKDKSPSFRRSSEERLSGRSSRSERNGSTSQVSPISKQPAVIPEQMGHFDDDGVYENSEREDIYLNTPARDDIYQNTGDISSTNIDSDELYLNLNTPDASAATKRPLATPRVDGGEKYMNVAVHKLRSVQEDDPSYLKLQEDGPEEVYEAMDHPN